MTDFLVVLNSAGVGSLICIANTIYSDQYLIGGCRCKNASPIRIADFDLLEIIHVSWFIDTGRKLKYRCRTFGPEWGSNRFTEF